MEKIYELVRQKSQLMYDINCIKRYIDDLNFDEHLKDAWEKYNNDLEEISKQIAEIKEPSLQSLTRKKLEVLENIKYHEEELFKFKEQLSEIDKAIKELK